MHFIIDPIIHFFSQFPPQLATFLMSMLPLVESQLSLPVAILKFNLPMWQAFGLALAGNMVPPTLILLFAKPFQDFIQKKSTTLNKAWLNQLARAQRKFDGEYEKYGLLGLMTLVIIPVPLTGAWTASLAAFVFGFPFKKAWPFIFIGICGSTFITLMAVVGIDKIF